MSLLVPLSSKMNAKILRTVHLVVLLLVRRIQFVDLFPQSTLQMYLRLGPELGLDYWVMKHILTTSCSPKYVCIGENRTVEINP